MKRHGANEKLPAIPGLFSFPSPEASADLWSVSLLLPCPRKATGAAERYAQCLGGSMGGRLVWYHIVVLL